MDELKWPNDADGDVFRRLESRGFDFSKTYQIDFQIDFDKWPPPSEAIEAIRRAFPEARTYGENESKGYMLFQANSLLTYKFVVETQAEATGVASPFGGWCDSWGILH